jgi:hypothetical protein
MSSSDFTFISLRNITAYQPTGSWVPQNYVLNMSTNGAAAWTNSITLETITGSTITGNSIFGSIVTGNTIAGDTITGYNIAANNIVGDNITVLSTLTVTSSFFTTPTNYTYTGTSSISSMLIVISDSIWKIPVEFVSALN